MNVEVQGVHTHTKVLKCRSDFYIVGGRGDPYTLHRIKERERKKKQNKIRKITRVSS